MPPWMQIFLAGMTRAQTAPITLPVLARCSTPRASHSPFNKAEGAVKTNLPEHPVGLAAARRLAAAQQSAEKSLTGQQPSAGEILASVGQVFCTSSSSDW